MITLIRWINLNLTSKFYANLYAALTIFLSIALLLWYPPLQSPHEWQHFLRGLTFSPMYKNGTLPVSVLNFVKAAPKTRSAALNLPQELGESQRRPFVSAWPVTRYPFVDYVPQMLSGAAGQLFRLAPVTIFYLARSVCLLSGIIFGYIILRLLPAYHVPTLVALLLPSGWIMRIQQYPDYIVNIASFFYFALIIYTLYQKITIDWKHAITFTITGIMLSISKIIYFPLTLCIWLIPPSHFKSPRQRIMCLSAIIGICFSVTLFNAVISYDNIYNLDIIDIVYRTIIGNDGHAMKAHQWSPVAAKTQRLLEQPVNVVRTVINTYADIDFWKQEIIDLFVWHNPYPRLLNMLGTFPLLLALSPGFLSLTRECPAEKPGVFVVGNHYQPSIVARLFLLGLLILMAISLALGIYIDWTDIKSPVVTGIQGRYYIPLLPFLFLCCSVRLKDAWFTMGTLFQLIMSLVVLLVLYESLFKGWMGA